MEPTPSGAMTVGSSNVYTATSSPSGYRLYLEMTGTNASTNSLIHTTNDSFTLTSSGTMSSPVALTNGTWGYAISHSATSVVTPNGFDDTYTTMESDTPTSAKFASIPAGNTPAQRIAETHGLGSTNLTVYYGVRADYTTASGAYTNKVLYTAIADDGSTPAMSVSPNSLSGVAGESVSIVTSLYSTAEIESHAYILTRAQYDSVIAGTLDVSTLTSQEMSCSRNTTVDPLALNCTTVAAADGAGYIYVDLPKYSTYYSAPVAINAPDFFTITTMQQMTPTICNSVATPSTSATTIVNLENLYDYTGTGAEVPEITLTDTRGTQPYETYKVRKLADGNCWMVENLRLADATLTPSDSDVNSNFTLTGSDSSTWCTENNATCINKSMVQKSDNADYGAYYNWYAATAGTGKFETAASDDAPSSVCPKGWKLPRGGSNSDFQALYNKYNSASAMLSSNGPNLKLAGVRISSSITYQGGIGDYWSRTVTTNQNYVYNVYIDKNSVSVASNFLKYPGISVRCLVADFWNITNMQQMTPEIAASVETPSASATAVVTTKAAYEALSDKTSNVPQRVLYDTRDSNSYTVRKLADGNVWMVENLRLTGSRTLTPSDSNVSSNWNLPAENVNFPANTCIDAAYNLYSGDTTYGTYYNWYAATAGTGTCSMTAGMMATNSICPKGWYLPTGGASSGEFQALYDKYNSFALMIGVPGFVMSGIHDTSTTRKQGEAGSYWSSTTFGSNYGYLLNLNQNNSTVGNGGGSKWIGESVRCLAREP